MNKAIRLLPIVLAAALPLAGCGSHDADQANATGEIVNEEVVPAGELGDVNASTIDGNAAEANVQLPADDAGFNDTASNAAGNGF